MPTDGDQIVYGSRFARSSDELVYFLVNPTNRTAHGRITVPRTPQNESTGAAGTLSAAPGIDVASFTFLDCYRGSDVQLEPLVDGSRGNLRVRVEGLGLGKSTHIASAVCTWNVPGAYRILTHGVAGCVYVVRSSVHRSRPRPGLQAFMKQMQDMTRLPLRGFSTTWDFLPQTMVPSPHAPRREQRQHDDMVHIPVCEPPARCTLRLEFASVSLLQCCVCHICGLPFCRCNACPASLCRMSCVGYSHR